MHQIILRVSTYPTVEKPGMGLHPSKLCGMKNYYTYYLTPIEISTRLYLTENTKLIEKYCLLEARPQTANIYKRLFFNFKRLLSLIYFSFEGIKIIFFRKIDIVHIHSPMYILIAFIGFLLRKKIYITFHGTDFHRIKEALWYRFFAKIFHKVFIISPDMKNKLAEIHGINKVILVGNGIDVDIYKNFNHRRKKQIITVGSLKEEKGFYYLIGAFANFIKEDKAANDYVLLIVGEGLLRYKLAQQIELEQMQNHIFLVGQKNRKELIKLYNESEIFVLASLSEGFPKVILEAMSCGCKIIATAVGSIPSILKNTNYNLVEQKNVLQLKASILETIHKENKNHSDLLQYYSWKRVRTTYENFYII